MRLFVYIVSDDTGFAPNPYWGYCTLATCKPQIRSVAQEGDWVIGLSPKRYGNKLLYAMQIKEKLTFDQYYYDTRFAQKRPNLDSDDYTAKCGDNIYYRNKKTGEYVQVLNLYHHGLSSTTRDTKPGHVLISAKDDFYYFGNDAIELPPELLSKIIVTRGHRSRFEQSTIDEVLAFLSSLKKGIHSKPRDYQKYYKGD